MRGRHRDRPAALAVTERYSMPMVVELLESLHIKVNHLDRKVTRIMSDQAHLDADVQAETAALSALEAEVAALKQQVSTNPTAPAAMLDFSKLDALVARMQGDVPASAPTGTSAAPAAPAAPAAGTASPATTVEPPTPSTGQ